jgi:hypothetical protein
MLQRLWDFGREGGGGWEEEDTLLSPLGVRAGCYISSGNGTTLRLHQEDLLGTKFSKVNLLVCLCCKVMSLYSDFSENMPRPHYIYYILTFQKLCLVCVVKSYSDFSEIMPRQNRLAKVHGSRLNKSEDSMAGWARGMWQRGGVSLWRGSTNSQKYPYYRAFT